VGKKLWQGSERSLLPLNFPEVQMSLKSLSFRGNEVQFWFEKHDWEVVENAHSDYPQLLRVFPAER